MSDDIEFGVDLGAGKLFVNGVHIGNIGMPLVAFKPIAQAAEERLARTNPDLRAPPERILRAGLTEHFGSTEPRL